jgi:general secretion pathway protein G
LIDKLRSLKLRPNTNHQKGFTLIELMVVISILGILAAVVTISMIGITSNAQKSANKAELKTVQVALDAMLEDPANNNAQSIPLDAATVCAPTSSPGITDMNGFVPSHPLYPKYLHTSSTHIHVWCDSNGVVFTSDPTS